MIKYVLKRLLIMIPILIAVAILIFTLMYFVPGDPASIRLGPLGMATQADIDAARESMGLNRPYIVRLGEYLEKLFFHFDFGESFTYGSSVGKELSRRFPYTLLIAMCSILITILVGIPVGVRAAVKANTPEDRVSMFLSLLGDSMPGFWLALLLVLLFSLKLGWLPSSGARTWRHFILPALANSIGGIAGIARQTRSSMLEVIRSDYVTTARSKGLSEAAVTYGHALPNALIPIITICGARFGHMLGGAVIIETIFSIPGIGSYLIDGINSRDYNVVQGSVIYIALTFSIMMLVTDIVYAYVDPRIKSQYMHKRRKAIG
jgi:peptide/nickel transport system permease protein